MTATTVTPTTSHHQPDGRRSWGALLLLTLAAGISAPGQTIGVSVFIDPMLESLPVSRTQLSTAYLVATLAGAAALPRVGSWTDRVGVRRALLIVLGLFAVATTATATVTGLLGVAASFLALRLLGQGSLGVVTGTGVAVWFRQRRGLAMGLLSTGSALLLAGAPLLLGRVIARFGWPMAWLVAAGGIAAVLVLVALLLPAQPAPPTPAPQERGNMPASEQELDRRQALRTWSFWGIAAISASINLLVTAVTFHHISVMAERGLTALEATAVFIPQMLGGLVSGLAAGTIADRWPGNRSLALCMGVCAVGLGVGTIVAPGGLALVYGLLIGAAPGAIRAVEGTLLPAWFGTRHVGGIRGALASITIGATAVGPVALSVLETWSFTVGLRVLAIYALLLIAVAWTVRPPRRERVAS
ncbi:MAG: MFS transporter [Nitriliruptoraceae bacterium]